MAILKNPDLICGKNIGAIIAGGNVDFDEIRASFGVGLVWITGMGPLTFSLAKPIKEGDNDDTEFFQFYQNVTSYKSTK